MIKDQIMKEKAQKQPVFMISDLDTLKVMADPLHLQIFELLNPEPRTINQIAQKLGTSSSRLYYHFNLMEAAGLVRVVETRTVNNIIEKIYWVTADDIDIDRSLLNFSFQDGQENITRVMLALVDATREDMLRSLRARSVELELGAQSHPRQMMVKKFKKRLRDETYQQLVNDFNLLLKTFEDLPDEEGGEAEASIYSVACFLYPSFDFGEDTDNVNVEEQHA
jgi:predicted transcriptional regulator